jgi:hypothetical protein
LLSQVNAAEWACAGDVEKPWVNAFRVEAMVAWKNALVLAEFEVFSADAATLRVEITTWGSGSSGSDTILGHSAVEVGHGSVPCFCGCVGVPSSTRIGRSASQLNIRGLRLLLLAEFDNGDAIENSSADTFGAALSGSAHANDRAGSVTLRVAMRSHSSSDDDYHEKCRNDSSDGV